MKVLIPDGESSFALPALQQLRRDRKTEVFVLSASQKSAIRFSRHKHRFAVIGKTASDEDWIKKVLAYSEKYETDLIFPVDTRAIEMLARAKSENPALASKVIIPDFESFTTANDKGKLYDFLVKNNIHSPESFLVGNKTDAREKALKLGFPLLAKPTNKRGGYGIHALNNEDDLDHFLSHQADQFTYLIQKRLSGQESGCNAFSLNGFIQQLTIQHDVIPAKNFAPAALVKFGHNEEIHQRVAKTIKALNYNGLLNFDLIYDSEQKKWAILEINPSL